MGPRRQVDEGLKPAESVGVNVPVVVSIVLGSVGAAAGFAWFLAGLAHDLGERIGRVEYSVQTLGSRIEILTQSVDSGVSVGQSHAWIKLARANFRAAFAGLTLKRADGTEVLIGEALANAIPDLPERGK